MSTSAAEGTREEDCLKGRSLDAWVQTHYQVRGAKCGSLDRCVRPAYLGNLLERQILNPTVGLLSRKLQVGPSHLAPEEYTGMMTQYKQKSQDTTPAPASCPVVGKIQEVSLTLVTLRSV